MQQRKKNVTEYNVLLFQLSTKDMGIRIPGKWYFIRGLVYFSYCHNTVYSFYLPIKALIRYTMRFITSCIINFIIYFLIFSTKYEKVLLIINLS